MWRVARGWFIGPVLKTGGRANIAPREFESHTLLGVRGVVRPNISPCHGEDHGFKSRRARHCVNSSNGRAGAFQASGYGFETRFTLSWLRSTEETKGMETLRGTLDTPHEDVLPGARTWSFPERVSYCAGSSMVERQVVALVMKGFDSLPALIRGSSNRLGHQALNLRTLVRIQPPVQMPTRGTNLKVTVRERSAKINGEVLASYGRVMKLVHVLASKARFCGFESHLCHHASVAQLVEQAALNRQVAGSSPVGGTMFTGSGVFTASATRGGSGRLGTGLQNRSDGFDSHSLLMARW